MAFHKATEKMSNNVLKKIMPEEAKEILENRNSKNSFKSSTLKVYVHLFTPEEADEITKNRNKQNFRQPKPNVVRLYVREIIEGRWMFNGDPIRFDWNGNLIDGGHRLSAVADSGIPVEFVVVEGLDPKCYQTVDIGHKKSAEDYLKKFASMYETGATAVAKLAMTLRRGNKQIGHSTSNSGISNTMMVDEYMDNTTQYNEATIFGKRIKKDSENALKPSHVGGIYYYLVYTRHFDKELVIQFFETLAKHSTGDTGYMAKAHIAFRDRKFGRSGVDIINAYIGIWNRWANSGKISDSDWFIAPNKTVKTPSKEIVVETPVQVI